MFVLHVNLRVRPSSGQDLEKLYRETFQPAISRQKGLAAVTLLRAREPEHDYVLSIAFHDESLQQKWVASEEHQRLWPQMESHCVDYTVKRYDLV